MRNFKEFINEKIAVLPTDEFLKLCEKEGLRWTGGDKVYEFYVSVGNLIHYDKSGLMSDREQYLLSENYTIVPASEFLSPITPTIEIFQSKQTIVCLKKMDGKVIAVGKAKCNPNDVFDFDFGSNLAFERMNRAAKPYKPTKQDFLWIEKNPSFKRFLDKIKAEAGPKDEL